MLSMGSTYAPTLHFPHSAFDVSVHALVVTRYGPQLSQSLQAPASYAEEYVSPSTHGLQTIGVLEDISSPQLTESPSPEGHFRQTWHWTDPLTASLIVMLLASHEDPAWVPTFVNAINKQANTIRSLAVAMITWLFLAILFRNRTF